MDTKHTPGPWRFRQFGGPQIGNLITGEAVCTMWGNDKRMEANVRLIEAAPDLLCAAEMLSSYLDSAPDDVDELHAIVRAAIAKATGAP